VLQVLKVLLDLKVLLEEEEHKDQPEHQVLLVLLELKEQMVPKVQQVL
jgi:hypothetical protein